MEGEVRAKSSNPLLIVFLIIIILLAGFIVYDKVLSKKDEPAGNTQVEKGNSQEEDNKGKVFIKRNGIGKYENVPSNIVGKYVNEGNGSDYFILNSDGTAEMGNIVACSDCGTDEPEKVISKEYLTYQLTYIPSASFDDLILEFYLKDTAPSGLSLYSPMRIGDRSQGDYEFMVLENTPTATAGETHYIKQK